MKNRSSLFFVPFRLLLYVFPILDTGMTFYNSSMPETKEKAYSGTEIPEQCFHLTTCCIYRRREQRLLHPLLPC